MNDSFKYDADTGRFEKSFTVKDGDSHSVYARTHIKENIVYIDYVHADPVLRGKGAASDFMNAMMQYIRSHDLKAIPICGYAANWLKRHTEYDDLKG